MSAKPVLYVEDDQNDAYFLQRAFRQTGVANSLIVVPNGQEAIDYVSGSGQYADRNEHPLPCLALLDLHLPKKSGIEVLTWFRNQATNRTLPIIILTSSAQDGDIERAYLCGANAYLVKPSQPEELSVMVKAIKDFWLVHNRSCARDS
jgi:CheY-like chemotaxis protein